MKNAASSHAIHVIENTLVWDNHACMPLEPDDQSCLPQIERCRAAGVDVVSLNVGCGPMDLASLGGNWRRVAERIWR